MTIDPALRDEMLAAVPSLRAFGISLCGNVDRADDLVQETLLRALANIHSFQPGTNMPAWLFTILRNLFRSEYRKRRREVEDTDGSYAESLKSQPEQGSHLEFKEFRTALAKLPPDQREALILVGASGFSYEEAAAICECAVRVIDGCDHASLMLKRRGTNYTAAATDDIALRVDELEQAVGEGPCVDAIEESPAVRTLGAWMQVGDERFDCDDIQRLYDSADYPLRRRPPASN